MRISKRLHVAQHHRGEGLVDLEQVDVVDRHAGFLQHLFASPAIGPVSIIAGLRADIGESADARARLSVLLAVPASLLPISTAAAPSTMPDELPA